MEQTIIPPYNIIIYCGGKCGGSSLDISFYNNPKYNSIHIHNNEIFKQSQLLGIEWKKTNKPKSIFDLIEKTKPVYIIDCYRNTIDRKISSYFQNLKHNRKYYKVPDNISIQKEVEFFQINIFHQIEDYESISEVMKHYEVEELDYKGTHWIFKKNNITFIRLKFNNIKYWNVILSNIMDEKIELKKSNLSSTKEYSDYYQLFKKVYYELFS